MLYEASTTFTLEIVQPKTSVYGDDHVHHDYCASSQRPRDKGIFALEKVVTSLLDQPFIISTATTCNGHPGQQHSLDCAKESMLLGR